MDIFFGTLNIPFLLPVILLLAGIGQGAFLWYFQQKNAGQPSYSPNEQVDLLVHDLQELQDIQEKLLQNFYPEQAKELPQNEAAEKQNEMLHFDEELLQKIDEAKLSWLTQVIEKRRKERPFTVITQKNSMPAQQKKHKKIPTRSKTMPELRN